MAADTDDGTPGEGILVTDSCAYCDRPSHGGSHEVRLRHATSGEKRRIVVARCEACANAHRSSLRRFLVVWSLSGIALGVLVFASWFVALDGSPRGMRVVILASVVAATLPGLGAAVVVRRSTLRRAGTREPRDVAHVGEVAAALREGFRIT